MDADSLLEQAKTKRMDDLRKRNDRFKGLQHQVTAHHLKHHHHKNSPEPLNDFNAQIMANHKARQNRQEPGADTGEFDMHHPDMQLLMGEDHASRLDVLAGQRPQDQVRHKRYPPSGSQKSSEDSRLVHRQLLAFPDRAQRQNGNPNLRGMRGHTSARGGGEDDSVKHSAEGGGHRKKNRRQFKPMRSGGDKVFRPLHSERTQRWQERRRQRSRSEEEQEEEEPIKEKPAWNFDLFNTKFGPPVNRFDEAIQGQFQDMTLGANIPENRNLLHPNFRREKKRGNVHSRYGKWVSFLEDKPELSSQLHQIGTKSLQAFGYEPPAPFLDTSGLDHDFQCDSTVVCPAEQ
jgi:hypothetical protein